MEIATLHLERFKTGLDRLVRPEFHWRSHSLPAFKVCGYTGLVLAIILSISLVAYQGLNPWVMAAIVLVAVATFYSLAMVTKLITGEERLIYYHHEIAVISMAAVLLTLLGLPALPYLDATILGIGIFLACGRVGCLMVGCCYGRPSRWGVCYREEHVRAGFPRYLAGVRLLPVQGIESLWALCVVAVGSAFVLAREPAGTALAWYVVAYGVERFLLEFVRGDPTRLYRLGFSEAQWTTVLLVAGLVWTEWTGNLPFSAWHTVVLAGLLVSMITLAALRNRPGRVERILLQPTHIREMALASERVAHEGVPTGEPGDRGERGVRVERTSLGVQLSASCVEERGAIVSCYSISRPMGPMSEKTARSLLLLVLQLRRLDGSPEFTNGQQGVYHACVRDSTGQEGR